MIPLLMAASLMAAPTERQWTEANAARWQADTGHVYWDKTRPDLRSETHAIEVDWATKKYQAIGQALYYAAIDEGRKPGIILLVRDWESERRHVYRCQVVCAKHDITLWIVEVD